MILLLSVGLAMLWCAVVAATAWMLTHPPRRTYASAVARGRAGDPGDLGRAFESWSVRSRGVDLPVWDVPGDAPTGPVIVMTHGWGDSRIGGLVRLPSLLPIASRVVLWDLPGHGEASGTCRLGMVEGSDLGAVIEAVRGNGQWAIGNGKPFGSEPRHLDTLALSLSLPPAHCPLVLYGWSLGAGVSLELAGREVGSEAAGVIAESPYRLAATPARNVLRARGLPWRLTLGPALWMVGRGRLSPARFDRARDAARVGCPVLVLHGEHDAVSPVEDGRDIAAEGSITEIAGGVHNDLWTEPRFREQAERAVREFVQSIKV